eukprot:s129_g15.t1
MPDKTLGILPGPSACQRVRAAGPCGSQRVRDQRIGDIAAVSSNSQQTCLHIYIAHVHLKPLGDTGFSSRDFCSQSAITVTESSEGMRLAWLIQNAIGGLRPIQGAGARVVRRKGGAVGLGLQRRDLLALLEGKAPVLVLPGAISDEVCREASDWLLQQSAAAERSGGSSARRFAEWRLGRDPDAPASDYSKLGYTKTDVLIQEGFRMKASTAAPDSYLQRAEETTKSLLSAFPPGQFPLDVIREELNSLPAVSCRLERCPRTAREFLPCVVRRMVPGRRREGNVHMDSVTPGSTLSVNVYLRVPEESSGGELLLHAVQKNAFQRFLNAHFFETIDMQNFYPDHKFYTQELQHSSRKNCHFCSMLERIEPIVYRPRVGDVVFIIESLQKRQTAAWDMPWCRELLAAGSSKTVRLLPLAAPCWCVLRHHRLHGMAATPEPLVTRNPKHLTTSCSTGSLDKFSKRSASSPASSMAGSFKSGFGGSRPSSPTSFLSESGAKRSVPLVATLMLPADSLVLATIQLIHMQFETSSLHRDSAGCRSKLSFRSQATHQQKAVSTLSMPFDFVSSRSPSCPASGPWCRGLVLADSQSDQQQTASFSLWAALTCNVLPMDSVDTCRW